MAEAASPGQEQDRWSALVYPAPHLVLSASCRGGGGGGWWWGGGGACAVRNMIY
jgi:hypothetical protein